MKNSLIPKSSYYLKVYIWGSCLFWLWSLFSPGGNWEPLGGTPPLNPWRPRGALHVRSPPTCAIPTQASEALAAAHEEAGATSPTPVPGQSAVMWALDETLVTISSNEQQILRLGWKGKRGSRSRESAAGQATGRGWLPAPLRPSRPRGPETSNRGQMLIWSLTPGSWDLILIALNSVHTLWNPLWNPNPTFLNNGEEEFK